GLRVASCSRDDSFSSIDQSTGTVNHDYAFISPPWDKGELEGVLRGNNQFKYVVFFIEPLLTSPCPKRRKV
ncbi:MAG: hypothetical protein AABZ40_02910, partial [Thermodesulfobacteriota bacterium]